MNSRHILAAVALTFAASGAAFAQEASSDEWLQAVSTKTRAEVQAELAQARATGTIKAFSVGYVPSLQTNVSRAEVVAAVINARASGELDRIDAEAHSFDAPAQVRATRLAQAAR